jgi:hypothetical protein
LVGSCQTDVMIAVKVIVRAVVVLVIELRLSVWDMEHRCSC